MSLISPAARRRVLLIAYSFPPVGGAGVQRPVKWTKYLPQFGWDVTVLTPENPSVPVRDESLLTEIPADTRIVRARTWEPSYENKQRLAGQSTGQSPGFTQRCKQLGLRLVKSGVQKLLQPDLQVLWKRNAIRAATRELAAVPHDAILVTVPPYSMLSIGVALKQRFSLPVVFDFRDEWDLSSRYLEQTPRDWWSQTIQASLQRRWLKQADAVIATTQASATTYQQKLAELGNFATSHCIYNGFDPEDFTASPQQTERTADADRFRLIYTGTLWNLTDIEPVVTAIESLQRMQPELVRKLDLVCVGRKTSEQQRILNRLQQTNCRLELHDYCHHEAIAGWLRSADALCLLLSDLPGAERVVPAKLFEYLASQKPILAVTPYGETSRILQRFQPQGHFVPRNTEGLVGWFSEQLSSRAHQCRIGIRTPQLEQFSRPYLTGRLAEVLNSVCPQSAIASSSLDQMEVSSLDELCAVTAKS